MGRGVDLRYLPADQFVDVVETFLVRWTLEVEPEETKFKRREQLLAELIRYNSDTGSSDPVNDNNFSGYIEPTNDGYYPGLEDGLVGG